MANRDTTFIMSDKTQLLITPVTEDNDTLAQPLIPAVIQHATYTFEGTIKQDHGQH